MKPKTKVSQGRTQKSTKKRSPVAKFIFTTLKIIIVFLIAFGCATAGIVAGAVYGYARTAPKLNLQQLGVQSLTTFIYDKDGNEIDKLTGKDNKDIETVTFKETPKYLQDAFVAIEDKTFWTNPGIDIRRIGNAVWNVIKNGDTSGPGGSTITQQVIKNTIGNPRVTLQRKVQEWVLAIELTKKKSKWQILETYMNVINMGHGKWGVQSASKYYFGKDVKDLDLAECALLAGITNSPGTYDPFGLTPRKSDGTTGRERAIKRQRLILKLMLEQEKIDQKEYDQAINEELKFAEPNKEEKGVNIQTYFVDDVIRQVTADLMEKYNISKSEAQRRIYNNGLKIYTTQDTKLQNYMDEVFKDEKYFTIDANSASKNPEHAQAAMVLMDPYGHVVAMYGGYGVKTGSNTLNRATQSKRQPGSSFKPIAVYGPAIDSGAVTAATIVDDVPVYMKTTGADKDKPYPKNYDTNGYGGLTSIRNGIKASINVVAAKVWKDLLGPDTSFQYLKKVNIDRSKERNVSLSLGGLEEGVNPLQMAAAYVPFGSKGMYYEPTTYTKVLDSDDNVILEKKQEFHEVYSEAGAFIMTDMLTEVVKPVNTAYPHNGTAATYGVITNKAKKVIPTAGKTGTTSNNRDKWFVGFSPYYIGAVWYGYDNKSVPITISKTEYNNAQKIWQAIMLKAHENLEPKNWAVPAGVVKKQICIYSGKVPSELCSQDPRGKTVIQEYFIKGTEPKDDDPCDVHVKAYVCKESQDVWKRNLIAGPYCPPDSVLEKVFIQRAMPFTPVQPGDPYPADWAYELPAGEYCNIHGAPVQPQTDLQFQSPNIIFPSEQSQTIEEELE